MKPMIFLNVGWMRRYRGFIDDTINGGGSYVQDTGYGHEILNFEHHEARTRVPQELRDNLLRG